MSDATQPAQPAPNQSMWLDELSQAAPDPETPDEGEAPALEPSELGPEEHYEISDEDSGEPDQEPDEANLAPAIPAPAGLPPEYADTFAQLTPELQSWVSTQEAQRTADYTAKTTELANQRKSLEAQQVEVAQQRAQYAQTLQGMVAQPPTPPSAELAQTDPDQYIVERARYDEQLDTYNKANAEIARLTTEAEQQQAEALKEFRATEDAKLPSLLGITDPARVQATETELKSYGLAQGISDSQWNNAAAVEKQILWKAMQWDKAVKGGKVTKAGARRPAPKSQKPGPGKAPGTGKKSRQDVYEEARAIPQRRGRLAHIFQHELENPGE